MVEVPVGFKWFVPGLLSGEGVFGGEESAGASFVKQDGSVWTTDKDGILLALLASEITAVTGKTPSQHYGELTAKFGSPSYARIDAAATREQKAALAKLSAADVTATTLAGEEITAKLTEAPGNGAPIGGLKVTTGTPGSPRGPPEPRMCTRFTRNRSRATSISSRSRPRPRRWWTPLFPRRCGDGRCGERHCLERNCWVRRR